jgi:hypothetical protein
MPRKDSSSIRCIITSSSSFGTLLKFSSQSLRQRVPSRRRRIVVFGTL